uniref:Uncharacterized protein n=1 Tax=Romanomermis culicivorax TaxID=13658 RepID=A0A915KN47_ROMCU
MVVTDALDRPGRLQLVTISQLKPFILCPARDTSITEASGSQCQQIDATLPATLPLPNATFWLY